MRTTVNIDDKLFAKAVAFAEPGVSRAELIRECVRAFIQRQTARRLAALGDPTMPSSTVNAKGQTTVPADVRKRIGATAGTRLTWAAMPDGTVVVRAKSKSMLELRGLLKLTKATRVSIDDMNLGSG